jgi:hypothetical protein
MRSTHVNTGHGIVRHLSIPAGGQCVFIENMWQPIRDFGISEGDLEKLQPTHRELVEVYSAIRIYMTSISYLRELKTHI